MKTVKLSGVVHPLFEYSIYLDQQDLQTDPTSDSSIDFLKSQGYTNILRNLNEKGIEYRITRMFFN